SRRRQAAPAEEFRNLGLLMIPLEQEDRSHLEALRFRLDLLQAHDTRAQRDAPVIARALTDDDDLVPDGERSVALERQAAPADVQGCLFGFPGLDTRCPVRRLDPDRHLPTRHVKAYVVAPLAIIHPDRIAPPRLGLVHRLLR